MQSAILKKMAGLNKMASLKQAAGRFFLVAIAAPVLATAGISQAQAQMSWDPGDGWYLNLRGGATFPRDLDYSNSATDADGTTDVAGRFGNKSGFAGFMSISRDFGFVEGGAELGYLESAVKSVTSNGSQEIVVDEDIALFTAMLTVNANLVEGPDNPFRPYVGVGAGIANWSGDLNVPATAGTGGAPGIDEFNIAEDEGYNLILAGIVGFDYGLWNGGAAGVEYRYIWLDSGYTEGNIRAGNLAMHALMATVSFDLTPR